MSVQFNLLPDVKLQFNAAQRTKKLVYTVCGIAVGCVFVVFLLSFLSVNGLQSTLLSRSNNDINTYSKKLKDIPNLEKILTIQNQLNALPDLHSKKHYVSRLITFLPQITPVKASISSLNLDTGANTISFSGSADSAETVNKFVDTLKFTTYGSEQKPLFTSVVLTSISLDSQGASYLIDAEYDPALFAQEQVKLNIPNKITTRSVVNTPEANNLFQPSQKESQ